ncbi:MAG: [FeFe] hydrogenase H-cluster maturation GTPase HydF [Lachnospiraceae bacterium]|jgi:[FeFe] hydrogenase H-cluster maturation GTPase HydF|nr:[FeFe] hydrogenase H-cluster maturation GTPase HydF [Lachnospiraceae bacterium]MCI9358732.1 [FeFe] hydrogenase H-cluster maturation GTPase HydF [Lachnospiraceae bacterium]
MGMNQTPASERVHISFFGKRNAGKSSVINAVTGQNLAIVSQVKGTTTDPVYKTMELLPLGPVMVIDTPGIDDEGELGKLRVKKSYQVLNKTDVALLVVDGTVGRQPEDEMLIQRFQDKSIPYMVVYNKLDLMGQEPACKEDEIWVSAEQETNIWELKEKIARLGKQEEPDKYIVRDLMKPGDFLVLVVPIDKAAPKGRLILPQQQTIRDILDGDGSAIVVKENGLKEALEKLGQPPRLVITDSQVFDKVDADTPKEIMLTSFSILFARYKGDLAEAVRGVTALDSLRDGDKVLIGEGCTHHRQCDDIGTVKIPRWIREYTGCELSFDFTAGTEFPDDLSPYRMIVHCGGCMLNAREMKYRVQCAVDQGIPITNYGILVAYLRGILKRSLEPFPEIGRLLD